VSLIRRRIHGGGNVRNWATTQWAPTLEGHDPNPPLPLEGSLVDVSHYSVALPAPVRRGWPVAVYAAALAFVPVVAAADTTTFTGAQGGGAVPRAATRQYQALAAPVLVPAAEITQWAPRYPDRLGARVRIPAGFTVGPLFVPDVTTPAPDRSWAPTYPDRAPGPARSAAFPPPVAPLFVPDVTNPVPDRSWAPTYPDQSLRPRLRPSLDRAQHVEPLPPAAPVPDQWVPTYPDRVAPIQRPRPSEAVAPLHVPDVTDPVPALSWAPTYPDRIVRPQLTGPLVSAHPVEPIAAAAAVITLGGTQGGGHVRGLRSLQYVAVAAPVLVPAVAPETITVEKWLPRISVPVRRRPDVNRITWVEFSEVEDIPGVPVVVYPDRIVRRRPVQLPQQVGPLVVPAPPVAPDQWPPSYPDRVLAARRAPQYPAVTAPLFVPDVTQPAPALSWAPTYPERVRRTPRTPGLFLARNIEPVSAVVAPAQWWPVYPPFVPRARRVPVFPSVTAPLYVPDVTVVVPRLSWAPVYPSRIWRRPVVMPVAFAVAPILPPAVTFIPPWAMNSHRARGVLVQPK